MTHRRVSAHLWTLFAVVALVVASLAVMSGSFAHARAAFGYDVGGYIYDFSANLAPATVAESSGSGVVERPTVDASGPSLAVSSGLVAPRQIGPIGNPGAFPFRGTTGLADKAAAREALGALDGTPGQLSAANRAIGRATSTSSLDVGTYGRNVVIRIQRPGRDGFQIIETVVRPDGSKSDVQMAYDAAGSLVHYDPKFP